MEIQPHTLSGLYYNYKKTDDKEIKELLDKVLVLLPKYSGKEGNVKSYFPINEKSLEKLKSKPRNHSLTFDVKTGKKSVKDLVPYIRIAYLVKSSSRFFLKPDIGEIIDQIPFHELYSDTLKAISVDENYETLPDTQGEHFLMSATLLTTKKKVEDRKLIVAESESYK